jgi:hypothetical protein
LIPWTMAVLPPGDGPSSLTTDLYLQYGPPTSKTRAVDDRMLMGRCTVDGPSR